MRGNPNDFDRWANESGDPQWTHENLLPFFKKMETYRGDFPIGEREKIKLNSRRKSDENIFMTKTNSCR